MTKQEYDLEVMKIEKLIVDLEAPDWERRLGAKRALIYSEWVKDFMQ